MEYVGIETLIGKTLSEVSASDDTLTMKTEEGEVYYLTHVQNCCENVYIDEIHGYLEDLENSEILEAYESSSNNKPPKGNPESYTWTFYHIRTFKGGITVKFYGTSNGYYSESAGLYKDCED